MHFSAVANVSARVRLPKRSWVMRALRATGGIVAAPQANVALPHEGPRRGRRIQRPVYPMTARTTSYHFVSCAVLFVCRVVLVALSVGRVASAQEPFQNSQEAV